LVSAHFSLTQGTTIMILKVVLRRDSLLRKLSELRGYLLHLVRGVALCLRATCWHLSRTIILSCRLSVCLLGLSTCSTYKRPICQEVISTVVIVLRELLLLVQLLGLTLVLVGIILLAREVPRE